MHDEIKAGLRFVGRIGIKLEMQKRAVAKYRRNLQSHKLRIQRLTEVIANNNGLVNVELLHPGPYQNLQVLLDVFQVGKFRHSIQA